MVGPISLIILYIIGIMAIVSEIFIPGIIIGICGAICMITSTVLAYHAGHNILGHVLLICGVCSIPAFLITWYKVFSKVFSINESEEGFSSADASLKDLISAEGVTITPLHPCGIARINGKKIDVITSGDMIKENTRIKVIEVEGNRVVVKAVKQ